MGRASFAAGENFPVADITLFAGASFADFAKVAIPVGCTALVAWRAHMAKRTRTGGTRS